MAYKKLERYTPTIFSPLLLNEENLPLVRTIDDSLGGKYVVDILKDYLCGEDVNTGLQVSSISHRPDLGNAVFECVVTGTSINNFNVGSNVTIKFTNFPNKFRLLEKQPSKLVLKVLDEDWNYLKESPEPNLGSDKIVYKSYMGWKVLSYEAKKHIVVKSNSLDNTCLALVLIDDDNKTNPVICPPSNYYKLHTKNLSSNIAPEQDLFLICHQLYNYESNKSLEYNIEKYKVNGGSTDEHLYFQNRMIGGAKQYPFNSFEQYTMKPENMDKWVLWGDDKLFVFYNLSSYSTQNNFLSPVLMFGELDDRLNKDNMFIASAQTGNSTFQRECLFKDYISLSSTKNSRKSEFISSYVSFSFSFSNISLIKGFFKPVWYKGNNSVSFPGILEIIDSTSGISMKIMNDEVYVLLPYYKAYVYLPISYSFRK